MVGDAERKGLSEEHKPEIEWPSASSARSRLCLILAGSLALHAGLLWQLPLKSDRPDKPESLQRLAVELVKAPVAPVEPASLPMPILRPPVEMPSIADTAPPVRPVVPDVVRKHPTPSAVASKPVGPGQASSAPSLAATPPTVASPAASLVDRTQSPSERTDDEPEVAELSVAPVVPDGAQVDPVLARMKPLEDDELARVKVKDRRPGQEIRRWDWLNEYLVRIERQVYATWAQAGRWPDKLNGVIRFQLDDQGRLQDASLQLASGEPALDRSLLTALDRTMKSGLAESRQLAAMNYRHFRFYFNAAGKTGRGQELVPWEQQALEDSGNRKAMTMGAGNALR